MKRNLKTLLAATLLTLVGVLALPSTGLAAPYGSVRATKAFYELPTSSLICPLHLEGASPYGLSRFPPRPCPPSLPIE